MGTTLGFSNQNLISFLLFQLKLCNKTTKTQVVTENERDRRNNKIAGLKETKADDKMFEDYHRQVSK